MQATFGGLIYSLLSGKISKEAIEFAVAESALKHSVDGAMFNRARKVLLEAQQRYQLSPNQVN